MRDRIDAHPDIKHESKGLSDAEIMRLIGASSTAAEGMFFPDTYLFQNRAEISIFMPVLSGDAAASGP